MKRSLLAIALFAAGCVSIPRDGIEGVTPLAPSTTDTPGVRALLQSELTPDLAVAVALANNARFQATLAELGIARADYLQASLITNPLFEAEIRFPAHAYELRLAQSLIQLLQLPRRRALGKAAYEAAKVRIGAEVMRFAAEVRARHTELLAASQRVALAKLNFEAAKTSTELAQRQHDAENITDLDLENEQARYEEAKLELAREEQRLVVAREAMIRAMGIRDATLEWKLPADFPPLPATEQDQQQLEQLAATRRLDIDLAKREADIARQRVPLARLAALGDVVVDGHYQRDAEGVHTVGPGVEVPIPIFNSGAAARSRAEAEYLRAQHMVNALLAESSSQLREARAVVAEARARVEYYRDVVIPRRERIVQLTTLEHNAMAAGPFQLLQSRQSEARARRDYVDAQRDYWIARNDLERAINGVLSEGGR